MSQVVIAYVFTGGEAMKRLFGSQSYWYAGATLTLGFLGLVAVEQAAAQVSSDATRGTVAQGPVVTVYTGPPSQQADADIDYVNAKALPLPRVSDSLAAQAQEDLFNLLASQISQVTGGESEPGYEGTGARNLVRLGVPHAAAEESEETVTPDEFGTNNHPFSTAQADLLSHATNIYYPYRASGKLFFKIGTSTFVCSASLIKRGVVVTAAHCVANFGKGQFYSGWQFVPGYRNGSAPFGVWTVRQARVLTSYLNGTDPCAVSGIVCQDDVAVLTLNTSAAGAYPGTATGWYGYGWNGYGFTGSGLTQITQIGYPVCLDNGVLMERNDSYGFKSASNANNTIIGSLMCGGSSGGPWLVNFGIRPVLTGTTNGTASNPNVVVGVTSWGYTSTAPKEQGASPFTSGNIVSLVNAACTAVPAACS
jgi:V8-like Glu-specific endopeptidase